MSLISDPRVPSRLLAGTNGYGVFISTNSGASWQETNAGITSPAVISKLAVAPGDPNVILAGSTTPRPGLYRSEDGGLTWSPALFQIVPSAMLIHPLDARRMWISAKEGLYSTEDGSIWIVSQYGQLQINDLGLSSAAPDFPYAVAGNGSNGFIMHLKNQSFQIWETNPIYDSKDLRTLAVNPLDANDLLVGGTTALGPYPFPVIYRTLDGGQSWHQVYSSFFSVIDIAIDPNNPQNRYLLTGMTGVQRSTDGGETWTDWSGDTFIYHESFSGLAVDDLGGMYAFAPNKIYYRAGDSADWQIVPLDFQYSFTGALWRGDAPFLLSSGSNGFWKKDLPPIQKIWLPALSK